jgi:hypothetical protein
VAVIVFLYYTGVWAVVSTLMIYVTRKCECARPWACLSWQHTMHGDEHALAHELWWRRCPLLRRRRHAAHAPRSCKRN